MLRRTITLIALLSALLTMQGCKEKPGGGVIETEKVKFDEIQWDGQKRAGVFYEIFVRSFADSDGDGIGDLNGITAKLDYLHELGAGGIWLMPINPSPSYHGYDVDDYKDVNPQYGTIADFDRMLAKAHSLGIKVILDFVINHTSRTHPWFTQATSGVDNPYRDYFLFSENPAVDIPAGRVPMTKTYEAGQWHSVPSGTTTYKYMGMFSSWMPDLNFHNIDDVDNSAAYRAICDAGEFWLRKGVDGFRLDAVKHIYQSETSDENPRFLDKFYNDMKAVTGDVYMVGEVLSESDAVAPYYAGLPALFDFSSWWRLDWALNNDAGKWYPKDLLQYEALFEQYRTDYMHITKLSNHDEDRTGSKLGDNIDKMKMAAKVLLTVSGHPYIYYGEEIGMLGWKPDENVREPFLWDTRSSDTYRTTWRVPTYSTDAAVTNLAAQQRDPASLFNVYKKFVRLRNADPVLAYGKMALPEGYNDADQTNKQIMVFYREYQGKRYIVLHNLSAGQSSYTISQEVKGGIAEHGGATVSKYGPTRYVVSMAPYSSVICEI